MSTYNLQAIQDRLAEIQNGGKPKKKTGGAPKEKGPTLPFWKPELGDSFIRFVPFQDKNGQPFYQVGYYTSELLVGEGGWRQVAPAQFGEEDPVFNLLSTLSSKRQPTEIFKLMNSLRPKDSYYAPVLVRGQEDKGVQVWELTSSKVKDIYAVLAHPDYIDEDLFDVKNGRDFVVTVTETDKLFKGNAVKDVKITERKKPSPLAATAAAIKEIVSGIPDFEAYFRGRLRPTEAYTTMLENALAGTSLGATKSEGTSTESAASGASRNAEAKQAASRNIDDAFADL